jgi:magnesium transporter
MTDAAPERDPLRDPDADLGRDQDYGMEPEAVRALLAALDAGDGAALRGAIEDLHAADLADLIEQLSGEDRRRLIVALGPDLPAEALSELEEGARDQVLEILDPAVLAQAVKELDSDDVVYLVEDLADERRAKVLEALDAEDRFVVAQSLTYPEYSAGRLMRREVVTAPPHWTVGQMIDFLRAAADLPEPFYDVIIVDPAMKPVGLVPLARILSARRPVTLGGIMAEEFRTLRADEPQEDVAFAFNKYHLVSAPVVDAEGRLAGVITIDDAMGVLDDEVEEDLLRLGGVGDEEISDTVRETIRLRFPWLAVNVATAYLAATVISLFDHTIERLVALAVLMPIVASMGGNAGTQSLTVAVRALATRSLTRVNAWRVVRREALVGLSNGLTFGVAIGAVGAIWFGQPLLGVVLALAMLANMVTAALAGVLVPMALDRAGADPAVSSGTFVTTMTDVVGFFAFLGLATLMLI